MAVPVHTNTRLIKKSNKLTSTWMAKTLSADTSTAPTFRASSLSQRTSATSSMDFL